MRLAHRFNRVVLTLMAISIFLLAVPALVSAQTTGAGCNEEALEDAKQYFNELRLQYINDSSSVEELDFRIAAFDYIEMAEQCYSAEHGDAPTDQLIDEGSMFMGVNGVETNFESTEYVLLTTKWGAGSPFTGGSDVLGPRIPGGTVTYSYMADGVDNTAEGASPNVAITSLATFSSCFLDEIELALAAWSAVSDIQFVQITDGGEPFNAAPVAHIRIGAHVFDGPSGILAHAFSPPPNGLGAAGDAHFDTEEIWACIPAAGNIGLGLVALHEFGHSIGLNHNDTADVAVMDPFYNPVLIYGPLADDILGVGELYGTGGAATTTHFGPVGIGTDSPGATLHAVRTDGSAKILVEEASSTVAPRTLFELKNPGNTKFTVNNTDAGVAWAFANPGTAFRLSRQGSGEVEMEIFNNGNVTIAGDLTQNSDINAKTSIRDIDAGEILHRVSVLPVSKWEYKDAPGESHIGPMAQDFYAAFGLGGSETGISAIDTAGVALTAIKALVGEIEALKKQNEMLQKRLDNLENLGVNPVLANISPN